MLLSILLLGQSLAEVRQFRVDETLRSAYVYPGTTQKNGPLVFAFHGHGGSARNISSKFALQKHWPEATIVYLQGLPIVGKNDPEGRRSGWQKNLGEVDDRDLKFFDKVYNEITKLYSIDKRQVFAMGHSNGGRFTYLLWAERGDKFAAVGPSASPNSGLTRKLVPMNAFIIAGEKDTVVPFASQQRSIDSVQQILKVNPDAGVKEGYLTRYSGASGQQLQTYIYPGTHDFPEAAIPLMVGFFKSVVAKKD